MSVCDFCHFVCKWAKFFECWHIFFLKILPIFAIIGQFSEHFLKLRQIFVSLHPGSSSFTCHREFHFGEILQNFLSLVQIVFCGVALRVGAQGAAEVHVSLHKPNRKPNRAQDHLCSSTNGATGVTGRVLPGWNLSREGGLTVGVPYPGGTAWKDNFEHMHQTPPFFFPHEEVKADQGGFGPSRAILSVSPKPGQTALCLGAHALRVD